MSIAPTQEAPIDFSLDHYTEGRVLEIALAKATTHDEQAGIRRLLALREDLLERRATHTDWMIKKRHERNEIYSNAKIKAINAMMPKKAELEETISACYSSLQRSTDVLKQFLLVELALIRAQRKPQLRELPEDVRDAQRQMNAHEEAFASEWLAAIGEPSFESDFRDKERYWAAIFRGATRPMFFVSMPRWPESDEIDAVVLGRAWNKLDAICKEHQVRPMSDFIGIDGQTRGDSAAAVDLLPTIDVLLAASQDAQRKIPAKRATREALLQLRAGLLWVSERQGHVYFEIDT